MNTFLLVPARIERGIFSNEVIATIAHLDGESSFFIQKHYLGADGASVRCARLQIGMTWELFRVPSLEDPQCIVLRRGIAREARHLNLATAGQ